MSYKFSTGSLRQGDIYYEDDRLGEPTYIDFGMDAITLRPSGSQILHAQADAVGINTTSPDYTLHVAGNMSVDQYIYHNGDSNTHINFADDKIVLKAGNISMVKMEEKSSAPHEVTINDGSNNIDFVVKGNGSGEGNPAFKVDASTNKVGINGVGTPDEALHVDGNIKVVGDDPRIKIDGDTDSHPGLELYENGTRKWIIYNDYTNDNLTLKTNSDDRVSIDQTGKVGIGTTSPDDMLTINGAESNSDETYIHFQEGGSDRAKVGINTSNNLVLHNQYTNKHIVFKVNDEGSTREGLRINGAVPEVVVNEGSESLVDFRVEGDGQTHLLFTDGANDRVGISTGTPHSGLQIDNSVAFAVRTVTQNHTVTAGDHTIFANATSTNITVTLPSAANIVGRQYIIKRVDTAGTSVTIATNGSETIDGASSVALTGHRSIVIQSDNSNWWIMAEYISPP